MKLPYGTGVSEELFKLGLFHLDAMRGWVELMVGKNGLGMTVVKRGVGGLGVDPPGGK